MSQESTDFSEFLPQREADEFTLQLLQLLYSQIPVTEEAAELMNFVLGKETSISLSIEATDLEDNTKIKHTAQFVSNINLLESLSTRNLDVARTKTKRPH